MKRDINHCLMLLSLSQKDIKALKGMKDKDIFEEEIFGFHAQQAVEKMLKAWLSLIGIEYPKIHDLEEIIRLLNQHGESIPERFKTLIDLSDFAVQFRYESFEDMGNELDRKEIIKSVSDLFNYIQGLMNEPEKGQIKKPDKA